MVTVENKHGFNPEEVRPTTTTDRLPMSPKQVAAVKLAKARGEKLAETHPEIADRYRAGTTKESGKRVYEKGSGAFGMTEEAKKQARGKGARNRPPNSVDYHAIGILRAIRQGKTPISDAEKKYILGLCDNPDFQYTTGGSKGKPKYRKIAEELERKFSVRRTEVACRCIVYHARKRTALSQ